MNPLHGPIRPVDFLKADFPDPASFPLGTTISARDENFDEYSNGTGAWVKKGGGATALFLPFDNAHNYVAGEMFTYDPNFNNNPALYQVIGSGLASGSGGPTGQTSATDANVGVKYNVVIGFRTITSTVALGLAAPGNIPISANPGALVIGLVGLKFSGAGSGTLQAFEDLSGSGDFNLIIDNSNNLVQTNDNNPGKDYSHYLLLVTIQQALQ